MSDGPSKKIKDGAAALFEEANPESGAFTKQSKATQEVFHRYAEAAQTGKTSKQREPDSDDGDASS